MMKTLRPQLKTGKTDFFTEADNCYIRSGIDSSSKIHVYLCIYVSNGPSISTASSASEFIFRKYISDV